MTHLEWDLRSLLPTRSSGPCCIPRTFPGWIANGNDFWRDQRPFDLNLRVVRKDGDGRVVRCCGTMVKDPDAKPIGIVGLIQDITPQFEDIAARKNIEQTLHHLSTRLLNVQDEERRRTAQFLHETTAQSLLALKLNLQAVARKHEISDAAHSILMDSLDLVEGAMQEIRTLSYVLHPPMLDEAGLPAALRWYTRGFGDRSGIAVSLDISEEFGRFPREVEMMMFRVVTESLSNVHRHSGSANAAIRLIRNPDEAVVEIEDCGRGISPDRLEVAESGALGAGIAGMHERVAYLGGKLTISSIEGRGTKMRLSLPVAVAAMAAAATA